MKKLNYNPTIPESWVKLENSAALKEGDRIWVPTLDDWRELESLDRGLIASNYWCVIRKQEKT